MQQKIKNKSTAVYAGTFDPITYGHMDIIQRAGEIFDRVIVAITSREKTGTWFPVEARIDMAKRALGGIVDNVEVCSFSGLLVDFVSKMQAGVIVRGLRAVSDYDYEAQMALTNRQLAPEIETVFLVSSQPYSFISSSIVREVAQLGGNVTSMVPDFVAECLYKARTKMP